MDTGGGGGAFRHPDSGWCHRVELSPIHERSNCGFNSNRARSAIPRAETSFEPGFMKSGELPRGETGDEIESNYPDDTGLPR